MIEPGKFLQQRYRIDKQIGQGGMGAVYVATDERFGSTVAIKETLCMDENFRKAIEREARLLNSLKHTALPRVSDHFLEDDGQFLVMEYIPGDDLSYTLERDQKPFPVDTVLNWADQLLDALDFLHTQEIPVIHRDIKPQNLKLTPRGQIVLLDFGLAKGNPTDAGHQTAAKSIFGYSRNYASLEQIQGTGTDPRSDLYSLAATLYHLMTGAAPEDALTRAMAVLSSRPDPLIPASSVNLDIPPGVAGVLQKALALNADERPSTAAEMREMLRESDGYAYLADTVANIGVANTAVFGQQTKLMPDALQTGIKTEVLPRNLSQLTAVSAGHESAPTNVASAGYVTAPNVTRRRYGVAAGVLSLLLVGCVAGVGVYTYMDRGQVPANKAIETLPVLSNTNSEANTAPLGSTTEAATNVESNKIDASRVGAPVEKPAETTKNNKPATSATDHKAGDGNATSTTAETPLGGDEVMITETRPDGTSTTRVIKKGQFPPPPNGQRPLPNDFNPFPRGVNPRYMTPAQKRRLRESLRNIRPPATPYRSPGN